jgi:hypothetical protein
VLAAGVLTKIAKEEEVCEQPPYFSLFKYEVCVEIDIEGCDHLHRVGTQLQLVVC